MANFTPSNLVAAQSIIQQRFTEAELRTKVSPALALGLKNPEMLINSHAQLRTREDRPIKGYMLTRNKVASVTERTHDHTGNSADSMEKDFSWNTFVQKFSISLKQMDNNIFGFNEALANMIRQAAINLHEDIETSFITWLLAQRTQVNDATVGGTFNATNNVFEVAAANKAQFWQLVRHMMVQNKYKGAYDVITDTMAQVSAEYLAAQGAANANNTAFQFQGLNFNPSIELSDANYTNGLAIVMPENSFAVLPWNSKQNLQGTGDYNSYNGGFGSMVDPLGSGLTLSVHAYAERADTSALNGSKQDELMQFELSIDLSPNLAPLSTANETVLYAVAQAAA